MLTIQAPEEYNGILVRRYQCARCNTAWLRRTSFQGIDLELKPAD